ncbi:MAG: hypothetical protein ACTHJX_14255 [Terriglobales bacterium]
MSEPRSISRREFCRWSLAGSLWTVLGGSAGATTPPLDAYGGIAGHGAAWSAGGRRFHTRQVNGRWLLVTPAGNPYWMLGVFDVDLSGSRFGSSISDSQRAISLAKYGSEQVWARQAVRRLRTWGFNCLAEYASEYALPIPLYGRAGNPEQMPFMAMIRPAKFSLTNRWSLAPGPVKDIVAATDPKVYRDWRGSATPDVFDPHFAVYARNEAAALAQHIGHSRWLVGVATDDADDLYGFGPGPGLPAARLHPHLGWLVLISNPVQASNPAQGAHYTDSRLHSKYALQDALRQRYGSIERLNQAWGARYTSFGSDGGWPHGRGLLDESGRGPWLGTGGTRMLGASVTVRADLDAFLYQYASTYFQAVSAALRGSFPAYLVFGPATLNGWNGLTRAPILRAASGAVDVVQACAASDEVLRLTAASTGNVPLVTWTGLAANADSGLYAYPHAGPGEPMYDSQAQRGAAYAAAIAGEFARPAAGRHLVVGSKFWAFADSWPEKMNWGLVSLRDNAYDGREAVRRLGRDAWGFPTGGEARDFGDSLTPIAGANRSLYQRLSAELQRQ